MSDGDERRGDGEPPVVVALSRVEALVLFEWLARHDGALPIEDPSEQDVLWRVEAALERQLDEVLASDYEAAVATARRTVRGAG